MSQSEAVLAWLRDGKTLTPAEAYERFGTLALHSRAAELRAAGHDVQCRIQTHNGKRYGVYSLAPRSPH